MISLPAEADLSSALQVACERGELFMLYQPKIALGTGEMVGVEALIRWNSSLFGLVLPSLFIPVAERCGGIDELTEWGLRESLRQWVLWSEQGLKTNLAFNVSALALRDLRFPDLLRRLCRSEGVPPDMLTLEITEGAAQNMLRMLDTITRIRIAGVSVEIDDFGTGYSSLLQLRELPYTGVKIDLSFVQDAARDPDALIIVESMIGLAHALGLTATAEGVEDTTTLELLRDLGCDFAQGFLFAPPLDPTELAPWLLRSAPRWRRLAGGAPALSEAIFAR